MPNTKVPIELSSTPGIIDNSTVTAITIDSAGAATFSNNVGIGTSSPTTALQVGDGTDTANWLRLTATVSDLYIGQNTALAHFGQTNAAKLISAASYPIALGTANAYPVIFGTNDIERMRIDGASGNVGIGTSAPTANTILHLKDTDTQIKLESTNGSNSAFIDFDGTNLQLSTNRNMIDGAFSNTGKSAAGIFMASPSGGSHIVLATASANNTTPTERLRIDSTGGIRAATGARFLAASTGVSTPDYSFASDGSMGMYRVPGSLCFSTGGTERLRLDASGNLGLGVVPTALGTPKLAVVSTAADWAVHIRNEHPTLPYGIFIDYTTAQNDAGSNFLYFRDGGAIRFGVASNGGISNYQANNVNLSDRREKTNFLPSKSYLDVICAIPVQTFNYIDQNMEDDPGLTLGVVAQDVQVVAPEFVMESNWGTEEDPKMRLSLYQTDLQYALMKCIQEQQDMITALTARIEALEGA